MTLEQLIETFRNATDNRKYDKNHPTDLEGFVKLKELGWPSKCDLISCASHDEIWLSVDPEWLASVAKAEDIEYLVSCGIFFDSNVDSLHMFV